MPPNKRSGPQATTPGSRSTSSMPTSTTNATTVQRGRRGFEANRVPSAFASQFPPDGAGRGWWWLAYRCPHCEASHLGRSRERVTDGLRRSRCGRPVWLVIARTYRPGRLQVSA